MKRAKAIFRVTSLPGAAMLCLLLAMLGCSKNDDTIPVTPKGNGYDSTRMMLIPAGSFRMGNIMKNPDGDTSELPVHLVTITRPFLMSSTEVTQEQYIAVLNINPGMFRGYTRPVEMVRWVDAIVYCNRRSEKEGLVRCYSGSGNAVVCDFTANGYRLPTEAEWEYACRGGAETDFCTGNMTHPKRDPVDPALDRLGWFGGNAGATTHPVGEKEANAFGLYDMHGNVAEWCWDWWQIHYYNSSPAENPTGSSVGTLRVIRGGSWGSDAMRSRSASRSSYDSFTGLSVIGFRVVRTM